jgi:hypothetical protein
VLNAIEDTFVDETRALQSFGTARELLAGNSAGLVSYIKFDAGGLDGEPRRAVLWLNTRRGESAELEVFAIEDGAWGEQTNANQAPERPIRSVKAANPATNGSWTGIDVTPLLGNGRIVSLGVTTSDTGVVEFGSRESGPAAPRLTVEIDPVLFAAGDIAHCVWHRQGPYVTAALLESQPGIIAVMGDLAYDNGSPGEFAECFDPAWGHLKPRLRPALGNHEYGLGTAFGYFDYFGEEIAGDPDRGYYSYKLGWWHVIVLNSNCWAIGGCQAGSVQERWLREDLAAHPAMCTVAYMHHPLFSSGHEGGLAEVRPLWQAMFEAGVDLVLAGHDHNYERFAPLTPDGTLDPQRGIRQFVVGTGGGPPEALKQAQPHSEARASDLDGVLKLTLRPSTYEWEFIAQPGKDFRDAGSGTCN